MIIVSRAFDKGISRYLDLITRKCGSLTTDEVDLCYDLEVNYLTQKTVKHKKHLGCC